MPDCVGLVGGAVRCAVIGMQMRHRRRGEPVDELPHDADELQVGESCGHHERRMVGPHGQRVPVRLGPILDFEWLLE